LKPPCRSLWATKCGTGWHLVVETALPVALGHHFQARRRVRGLTKARVAAAEQFMGFVPNSSFTMARVPGLYESFSAVVPTVFFNDLIPPDLVQMLAFMSCAGSGCRYCQAHTSKSVSRVGVDEEKVTALWEFETSDRFAAIVAAISIFGYLNRWNDTIGTDLEDVPGEFADRILSPGGWHAGHHRAD
jgi:hypothetical protein